MARIAFVSFYDEYVEGVRYISACLKQQGHDCHLITLKALSQINSGETPLDDDGYYVPPCHITAHEIQLVVDWVRDFDPLLICITLTSNFTGLGIRMTQEFRKVSKATIAWGGIDPTINPDVAIEHADVVCIGEGEYAVMEMVDRLTKGQSPAGIQNLWVRVNGHIEQKEQRPTIQDLDSIPFSDWDLNTFHYVTDGRIYHGGIGPHMKMPDAILVQTSRGCPFKCTYCCHSELREILPKGKYVRRRTVDHVIKEIKHRLKIYPNLKVIEFFDDVFIMDRRYMKEFADKYAREIHMPFWCYAYPINSDPEILTMLRNAGMYSVTFGIQSCSPRILSEVFDRPTKDGEIQRMAQTLRDCNIDYVVDLIGSNPLEEESDRRMTLEVMLNLARPYLLHPINPLSLYRNYPIVKMAEDRGIRLIQDEGANKFMPEHKPEYLFWDALYTMAQFEHVPKDTVWSLSYDPYMREHPEALWSIAESLCDAMFLNGDVYTRKEHRIKQLESEIATIRGSRFYQVYEQYKRFRRGKKRVGAA